MKKEFTIIFFLVLLGLESIAQTKQDFSGKIVYEEIYRNPDVIITEKVLYFNYDQSYFEWFSKSKKVKKSGDGTTIYPSNSKKYIESIPRFQLHNLKKKEFFIRLFNRDQERLIKNEYYNFDWVLLEDVKKIDRFTCQKAQTNYKGRIYTAWFTNDIPLPYGPGRFHGLGGIILELSEENGLLYFQAKSVSINNGNLNINEKINKINFSEAISESDYEKISKKELKDLESRLNASRAKGKSPIRFSTDDCTDCGERLDKTKKNDNKN